MRGRNLPRLDSMKTVRKWICRICGHRPGTLLPNIVEGCQLQTPDGHKEVVTMRILTKTCCRCGQTLEMHPAGIVPSEAT